MNILFVTTEYIEHGKPTTGFPAYLYRVSQALISMGHTPIILTTGGRKYRKEDNGILVYSIRVPSISVGKEYWDYLIDALSSSWSISCKIKELEKEIKIDIIQFTSLKGLGLLYRGKIPAVLRLSSYARIYYSTHASVKRKQVELMALLERLSARGCKAVYAPCAITAQKFGQESHRKVYVLETPFMNDVVDEDICCIERLKGKKFVLFFGIFTVEKGILVISKMIHNFLDKYKDFSFVFVGKSYSIDGRNAVEILKRAAKEYEDRVVIFKAKPHEQLYPIIKAAEFVVLPYLNDNLPNACLEAMSFGKVVIGTDGGSFEQVIMHGKSGILCKSNDANDLLDKIDYVMSLDDKKIKEIGENAKKRIELLKPERAVRRLIHFYSVVMESKK